MNKTKDAVTGVDGTVESAVTEIKAYHVTERDTACDAVPGAAILGIPSYLPRVETRSRLWIDSEASLEFQQGRSLIIVAPELR